MIGFIKNLTSGKKDEFFLQVDDAASIPPVAVAPTPEAVAPTPEAVAVESVAPAEVVTPIAPTPVVLPPAPVVVKKAAPPVNVTFAPQYFGTTTTFPKKRKAGPSMNMFREMAQKVQR